MKFELPEEESLEQKRVNDHADEAIFRSQEALEAGIKDEDEHRELVRSLQEAKKNVTKPEILKAIDQTLADIEERYGEI